MPELPEINGEVGEASSGPTDRGASGDAVPVALEPLAVVLATAQRRGLLGGNVVEHLHHSEGFVELIVQRSAGPLSRSPYLDLGSGGGVPGLVVAVLLPGRVAVLVDASLRRCRFLEWAVEELGMTGRVRVVHGRAEELARGPLRETCGFVTSRAFGPPAATAECARGFLLPGGCAVISDPPTGDSRWPSTALADLGYGPAEHRDAGGHRFVVLEAVGSCREDVPRRDGLPGRRPLF